MSGPLRIATWNCFGAPQSLEDFLEGRPFWPERMTAPRVFEALSCFDVVCVQENFVTGARERLEALQAACGFSEIWLDPMGPDGEDKTLVGGGLAILSRFPLRARFHRLPRGVGADGFARKGFAVAEVRLPGGREVLILNTHLQADDERVSLDDCQRVRDDQLEVLSEELRSLVREGAPLVVCGDLNVACGTGEYERMARRFGGGVVDVAREAGLVTYDTTKNDIARAFHEGGAHTALIDYVWVGRRGATRVEAFALMEEALVGVAGAPPLYEGRAFASDHFGIGVTIDLE